MNKRTPVYKPEGEEARRKIMEYLLSHEKKLVSVSLRGIKDDLGMSLNSVYKHMEILETQGKIRRNGTARHIEILKGPQLSPTQTKNKALAVHIKTLQIRDEARSLLDRHKGISGKALEKLRILFTEYEALQ